ncbi:MAG: methyl-accepting chemotaxis protein, partial [Chloroflexia bacterium]|nr:methyl-accepting chemotaxis protein [Chloroflexia bacterium]
MNSNSSAPPVWRKFLGAPAFEDEEKSRIARLLHIIVLLLLGLSLPYALSMLFTSQEGPAVGSTLLIVGAVDLLELVVYGFNRCGRVRLAAWLQTLFLWGVISAALWTSGGLYSPGTIGYTIVILMGGLLLGLRAGAVVTLLSVLGEVIIAMAQQNDLLPAYAITDMRPQDMLATHAVVYIVIAILLGLAVSSIQRGLQQSRLKEVALAERNEQLQAIRSALEERNRQLSSTVQQYVDYMSEVARGNLSQRLSLVEALPEEDPLLLLGQSLNETAASLQRMIQQMRSAANNLSSAAAEILAASTQQAAGASQQSTAIAQTSTTIDEVRTIAEQTATRARGVAELAQRTAQASTAGEGALSETVRGM